MPPAWLRAARDQMTGTTVIGQNAIARLERVDDAQCRGLLPHTRAGTWCAGVLQLDELLFVGADEHHDLEPAHTLGTGCRRTFCAVQLGLISAERKTLADCMEYSVEGARGRRAYINAQGTLIFP